MSINRQVNKENKVKIFNEMLFRLKKEGNSNTFYNTNEC